MILPPLPAGGFCVHNVGSRWRRKARNDGEQMAAAWCARGAWQRARHQHAADPGNESRRSDHACARRGREVVGGHGRDPSQGQDGRPPSRRGRERDLRRQRARADEVGRPAGVHRRSRSRATSSTCRPSCRTRRSTRATASRCRACSVAADRSRSWSISTCPTSSPIRKRCTGSTTSIPRRRAPPSRAWRAALPAWRRVPRSRRRCAPSPPRRKGAGCAAGSSRPTPRA